jgi:hypothetical protein
MTAATSATTKITIYAKHFVPDTENWQLATRHYCDEWSNSTGRAEARGHTIVAHKWVVAHKKLH